MEDRPGTSKVPDEQQQSPTEPSSTLAIPTPAAVDTGSDFYNTPLTGQTPVYPAGSNSNDNSVAPSPSKPVSAIPGLSILNNSDQAQQHETNTETEAAPPNGDQVMENVPDVNDMLEPISSAAEPSHLEGQNGNNETGNMMEIEGTENRQTETIEKEHPEWEVDSSPYESSTDSSTDSSDDSDDEDDEDYPILSAEETARILMQAEGGSDDEGEGKPGAGNQIRSAHEEREEVAPIPDITVSPDMKIVMLGHVETIVENIVLIKASLFNEIQVLEPNSLLCLHDRTVIGVVADTFGRVEEPLYTIRFADPEKIKEFDLTPATPVYYVEGHSTYVFTQTLKNMKGSDASNFHDEEVGEDEIEFSDDEAEAEYKRRLKQKKRERREGQADRGGFGGKGRKDLPGPSRLRQSELNYDDEDRATEDGYTPLARPKDYHEMMGHQEAPVEGPQSFRGRGNFRGRGRGARGFDRGSGRGGRGRGGWDSSGRGYRLDSSRESSSTLQPNFSPQPSGSSAFQYPQHPYAQQFQQAPQNPAFGQILPQAMPQYPFQMPSLQQNPFPQFGLGAHINPTFFANLQQQLQQGASTTATQAQSADNQAAFSQIQASLDILQQLSRNGNGNGNDDGSGGNPSR
ncbi:Gar1/Naf1 RNA binding region-domain-containing protein [Talaromyces proteolyticus]|uniref:H/ACA ribonucleoprotein complex non-core subunit NAF1 n=1 Tax=Talaromyces proteolyticus TaxID=1131652 RepID=A0AAD4Q1D2_9EURO|nr:Gar1/Naf1 RNA binding region-domain-containing protein [Talaromyces proteolyticus]KAH8698594.1 Gar1/Naf1 RNA binding region-domain-containing protein [Talaromyces proteolyticus]